MNELERYYADRATATRKVGAIIRDNAEARAYFASMRAQRRTLYSACKAVLERYGVRA